MDKQLLEQEAELNSPFADYNLTKVYMEGYRAALKSPTVKNLEREVERLKALIKQRERESHYSFYSHASTMTDSQIENQFKQRWETFKTENNL